MDKTNINALVQSVERSLHLIHENRNSKKLGLNFSLLYPSITSLYLNILAGKFTKWYPLAHLAAVTMSMFLRRMYLRTIGRRFMQMIA